MKDPYLPEQYDRNAASFPLADLTSKFLEQSFDIPPWNAPAYRVREDQIKCSLVSPLHLTMVLKNSTSSNRLDPYF
ncbi:MAG: hypothetical protein QNJ46_19040 [Leptolyngbyaceae cyanobacterium MO_188.B28]|nr:hypothetical protein [Leptolyngbyaceae cyanobacterium MO_188.B28]